MPHASAKTSHLDNQKMLQEAAELLIETGVYSPLITMP
jgi:hypothetical protein